MRYIVSIGRAVLDLLGNSGGQPNWKTFGSNELRDLYLQLFQYISLPKQNQS